jgi:hypothetical protein
MPFPPDRPPHILEQDYPALPLPPLNFSVQSGLEKGVIDLRWDVPTNLTQNSRFSVIGVNIYRSFDSEFGPYHRLNDVPIGTTFWRDMNQITLVLGEDISKQFIVKGTTDPDRQWVFRTRHNPIVIQPWLGTMDCASLNVYVTINGVRASVSKIVAAHGEVTLNNEVMFDVVSQQKIDPVLPTSDSDVILATYRYLENEVKTDLGRRIHYRITTVALDGKTNELIETPLDRAAVSNNYRAETLDYIWREAVRRNRFLLYQAGERVKLFIKRTVGQKCGCRSDTHKQPSADCLVCYGTGIIGGYDGPYDIIVCPDDSERAIEQSNRGRTVVHVYDSWTGPSPLLSQRDFVVKLNGERYAIGPVRMPTARGMQLQQHFPLSYIDEPDMRYNVPVINTATLISPQTRYVVPGQGSETPMVTERQAIPDNREFRGNTPAFENTNRR